MTAGSLAFVTSDVQNSYFSPELLRLRRFSDYFWLWSRCDTSRQCGLRVQPCLIESLFQLLTSRGCSLPSCTMPRLRVLAGPSSDDLRPITVNDGTAHPVTSDTFEGRVAVFLRYDDEEGESMTYFDGPGRENVTWSIQVQGKTLRPGVVLWLIGLCSGRFLQPRPANSVVFGNTFERPFKLPVGSSAVMKFMQYASTALACFLELIALQASWTQL